MASGARLEEGLPAFFGVLEREPAGWVGGFLCRCEKCIR